MIKANKISKSFIRTKGESNIFYAVNEMDLEIEDGNFIIIIGKSGSGKTTLINMLSGLLTPSSGNVLINDTDIYSLNDKNRSLFRNKNIGFIPQGQTGLQNLTILENILLPTLIYEKDDKKDLAIKLLNDLDIIDLKDSYPNELSGGELRRMAIARAIIMNPSIIFADEPTGDLDEANTKIVLDILRKIANSGKTIIMVTHDKDAISYADIIYKMENGTIKKCD
ncbi:MAG: ABC transporter ATP-binding protein [Acholeplasmatales bacterium]|nr:ABC transporter ATP-binding protein [Acholeplasmatales bacterium]